MLRYQSEKGEEQTKTISISAIRRWSAGANGIGMCGSCSHQHPIAILRRVFVETRRDQDREKLPGLDHQAQVKVTSSRVAQPVLAWA